MFCKIYNFKTKEQFDHVIKVCEDIVKVELAKGGTFVFTYNPQKMEIQLIDKDEDKLHQRATWIVNKADPQKTIVYDIVKNEVKV